MAFKPTTSSSSSPIIRPNASSESSPVGNSLQIFESLGKQPTTTAQEKPAAKESPKSANPEQPSEDTDTSNAELADEGSSETLAGETPEAEGSADAGNALEVTHRGKKFSFKLDKNDKKLQQTLAYGLEAPKLAEERKALKKELAEMKTQMASSPETGRYMEAAELAKAGHLASSVKEFLGEELFTKFYNEEVVARLDYESASPEEKLAIMDARHKKKEEEYKWKLERGQKGVDQKNQKTAEARGKEAEDAFAKMATSVLQSFDFKKVAKDSVTQEALMNNVWKLAMLDVEDWVEGNKAKGKDVTPGRAQLEKAFARHYKLLTGHSGSAKTDVRQPASGAKAPAAKAAGANYDKGVKADEMKGLSPIEMFKKLGGR